MGGWQARRRGTALAVGVVIGGVVLAGCGGGPAAPGTTSVAPKPSPKASPFVPVAPVAKAFGAVKGCEVTCGGMQDRVKAVSLKMDAAGYVVTSTVSGADADATTAFGARLGAGASEVQADFPGAPGTSSATDDEYALLEFEPKAGTQHPGLAGTLDTIAASYGAVSMPVVLGQPVATQSPDETAIYLASREPETADEKASDLTALVSVNEKTGRAVLALAKDTGAVNAERSAEFLDSVSTDAGADDLDTYSSIIGVLIPLILGASDSGGEQAAPMIVNVGTEELTLSGAGVKAERPAGCPIAWTARRSGKAVVGVCGVSSRPTPGVSTAASSKVVGEGASAVRASSRVFSNAGGTFRLWAAGKADAVSDADLTAALAFADSLAPNAEDADELLRVGGGKLGATAAVKTEAVTVKGLTVEVRGLDASGDVVGVFDLPRQGATAQSEADWMLARSGAASSVKLVSVASTDSVLVPTTDGSKDGVAVTTTTRFRTQDATSAEGMKLGSGWDYVCLGTELLMLPIWC